LVTVAGADGRRADHAHSGERGHGTKLACDEAKPCADEAKGGLGVGGLAGVTSEGVEDGERKSGREGLTYMSEVQD